MKYVSISKLISLPLNIIKPIATRKQISIQSEFSKYLPSHIEIDRTRLSQIISNLLSNAVKFTKEKGIIYIKTLWNYKCLFSGECEKCPNCLNNKPSTNNSSGTGEDTHIPEENISIEMPNFSYSPNKNRQINFPRANSESPTNVLFFLRNILDKISQ